MEPAAASAAQRTSGHAIAALVLGIVGFVALPLIPSILAVVFGHKARTELRNDPALGGDGMAFAGLLLGYAGIAFTLLLVPLLVILVAASG